MVNQELNFFFFNMQFYNCGYKVPVRTNTQLLRFFNSYSILIYAFGNGIFNIPFSTKIIQKKETRIKTNNQSYCNFHSKTYCEFKGTVSLLLN